LFSREREKKDKVGDPSYFMEGKNKHKCKLLLEGVVGASSKKGFSNPFIELLGQLTYDKFNIPQ
jgi:hypothetical protein